MPDTGASLAPRNGATSQRLCDWKPRSREMERHREAEGGRGVAGVDRGPAPRAAGELAREISATVCRAVAWFDLGRASSARTELNEVRLRATRAGPHLYAGCSRR